MRVDAYRCAIVKPLSKIAIIAMATAGVVAVSLASPATAQTSGVGVGAACVSPKVAGVKANKTQTDKFARYGVVAPAGQWAGADSNFSVRLPDGRIVWLYSDTFLGPVKPDGSLAPGAPLINNSMIVEGGGKLQTIHGGTASKPAPIIPAGANRWYWVSTASVEAGALQVIYAEFERTGQGSLEFAWKRNVVARFALNTLGLIDITALPSSVPKVQWNAWRFQDGGYTYIYGVEDLGTAKYMRIARVSGGDLRKPWQFYTGAGWSGDQKQAKRVMSNVGNNYSISKVNGAYVLVTQDNATTFGNTVVAYTACSPVGPFTTKKTIYSAPETGATGIYKNKNVIMYNAHEHPALRSGNTLRLSYDVNSLNFADVLTNVGIYRPRFIDVTFAWPVGA